MDEFSKEIIDKLTAERDRVKPLVDAAIVWCQATSDGDLRASERLIDAVVKYKASRNTKEPIILDTNSPKSHEAMRILADGSKSTAPSDHDAKVKTVPPLVTGKTGGQVMSGGVVSDDSAMARYMVADKPKIITLCGSTRFTGEMLREAWRLTIAGNIVIHWNILEGKEAFSHGAEREGGNVKEIIDALYLHKVAMADEVRVINVDGYVGESTTSEVRHGLKLGKHITWLEPDKAKPELCSE